MRGESTGMNRPKNSILAEYLDFESSAKTAPVITEDVTMVIIIIDI